MKELTGQMDAIGGLLKMIGRLRVLAAGTAVPADGTAGYETGCLFFHLDGGEDTALYVNDGSKTSCDFNPLPTAVTSSSTELSRLAAANAVLATEAGVGITAGTGTVYKSSVLRVGGIYYTNILIDLTGLASSTTDLDVIGVAGGPAHIGQITAARNGTILHGRMTCLEVPAGGADDIDLYAATEGTGEFDSAIGDLAETAIITSGAAWTAPLTKTFGADVAANKYLYLTGGEAGTAATYTAGKFLIELFGY